jgi:hypothetical protein
MLAQRPASANLATQVAVTIQQKPEIGEHGFEPGAPVAQQVEELVAIHCSRTLS